MSNNSDKTLVYLNENKTYDQNENELLIKCFQQNEFNNFQRKNFIEMSDDFSIDLAKICGKKIQV